MASTLPIRRRPDRHNYCLNTVPEAPCTPTGSNVVVSAWSYHPGGVVASLADGSVRYIQESIDLTIYHAMGTRSGGELVATP